MQAIRFLQNFDGHSLVFNYVLFYICVNFVNKYVLSVLRFTFPTIFQGWQVLAGAIILRILSITGQVKFSVTEYNSSSLMSWSPAMVFYTFSIYTGSVALANLPIPIYFSLQCIVTAANFIIDFYNRKRNAKELLLVPPLLVFVFATICTDPEFNAKAYKWAAAHVIFVVLYNFFEKTFANSIILGPTDRLFCNYVFSMILLAPSSLFLGDIFAAQNFGYFKFYQFYAGCFASGVLGVLVSLHGIKIKDGEKSLPTKEFLSSLSKVIAAFISVFLFNMTLTPTNALCIIATLGTNFLMNEISSAIASPSHEPTGSAKNGINSPTSTKAHSNGHTPSSSNGLTANEVFAI